MLYLNVHLHPLTPSITATAISILDMAKAYHVELLWDDGYALNAQGGTKLHYVKRDTHDLYHTLSIPLTWINDEDVSNIRKKADDIVSRGCGYDYMGAIFGKFYNAMGNPDKWFCSEISAHLIAPYTPTIDINKWYSPGDLWRIVSTTRR